MGMASRDAISRDGVSVMKNASIQSLEEISKAMFWPVATAETILEVAVSRFALVLVLCLAMLAFPATSNAETTCEAPPLSDDEVRTAVYRARATRTDMPAPFPEHQWSVKRRGCYYVYLESPVPEAPDSSHMITLNDSGEVVDIRAAGRSGQMSCPAKVFTEEELAEVVRKARAERSDLPPPFEEFRPRVDRLRCLYLYFEHRIPERRGDYNVFTIDPLGGLIEFNRSQPY